MILKVLAFLMAGAIIVALAWGLAGVPGHFAATMGQFTIETSIPFAILLLIALVLVIILLLRILRALMEIPRASAGWRHRHRLALGQKSITRVLVALAAGEQVAARKEARRARQLLGDAPQTLLLVAEANRLSGREGEAEEAFRTLAKQPDAKFLGLRGLLRQAVDRRDWPEALVLAKQAEVAHPGTLWLRQQRAQLALQTENWSEALELVGSDAKRAAYYVAAADAEPDQVRALSFARQAWKQDPAFAPAAIAYASRLRAAGNEKRARACVADAWRHAPHPDLADFALALEPDKLARARAAKLLIARNPTHLESRILLAQVALDAGLNGEARHQIEAAQADGNAQRRLCLLLAEVEEQERGDTEAGRLAQREALRLATIAEPDPHWQCSSCHTDQAKWRPKCDTCGSAATIEWVNGRHIAKPPVIAGQLDP
jgi:HemY protein